MGPMCQMTPGFLKILPSSFVRELTGLINEYPAMLQKEGDPYPPTLFELVDYDSNKSVRVYKLKESWSGWISAHAEMSYATLSDDEVRGIVRMLFEPDTLPCTPEEIAFIRDMLVEERSFQEDTGIVGDLNPEQLVDLQMIAASIDPTFMGRTMGITGGEAAE